MHLGQVIPVMDIQIRQRAKRLEVDILPPRLIDAARIRYDPRCEIPDALERLPRSQQSVGKPIQVKPVVPRPAP